MRFGEWMDVECMWIEKSGPAFTPRLADFGPQRPGSGTAALCSKLVQMGVCSATTPGALESVENLCWWRRHTWLRGIVVASTRSRPSSTAVSGVDPEIVQLLRDRRLVRAKGALATSGMVGITASFLSTCCDQDEVCPRSTAVRAEYLPRFHSELSLGYYYSEGSEERYVASTGSSPSEGWVFYEPPSEDEEEDYYEY